RFSRDWSSDVCSSDLATVHVRVVVVGEVAQRAVVGHVCARAAHVGGADLGVQIVGLEHQTGHDALHVLVDGAGADGVDLAAEKEIGRASCRGGGRARE